MFWSSISPFRSFTPTVPRTCPPGVWQGRQAPGFWHPKAKALLAPVKSRKGDMISGKPWYVQNTEQDVLMMYWYPSPDLFFMILQPSSPVFVEASHCSFWTSTSRALHEAQPRRLWRCFVGAALMVLLTLSLSFETGGCVHIIFCSKPGRCVENKERFLYLVQVWRDFLVFVMFHWNSIGGNILRTPKSAFHIAKKHVDWS